MRWRFPLLAKTGTFLVTTLAHLVVHDLAWAEDQKLRLAHRLLESRNELLVCAQSVCPAVISTDCVRWLAEVETALPSVVLKAIGPLDQDLINVSVWIDGVKVLDKLDGLARPLNPGAHRFRFEAEGMQPVEEQVLIHEGETRRLFAVKFKSAVAATMPPGMVLESGTVGRAAPILPIVLAGVGAVALGSFAYFGISGREDASDLASSCGATKTCLQSQVDPVRNKLIVADASLGVSLVSLGIATYLFVTHYGAKPKQQTAVRIGAGPSAGTVELGLSF
jgi:hypothetical protein